MRYDPVGALIRHLQVVRDDQAFMRKTGQRVTIDDYEGVKEKINSLILTHDGKFTRHINRVEQAGFYITLFDGVVTIYFVQTQNVLSYPFHPSANIA